jgi:hypothetical protein
MTRIRLASRRWVKDSRVHPLRVLYLSLYRSVRQLPLRINLTVLARFIPLHGSQPNHPLCLDGMVLELTHHIGLYTYTSASFALGV